MKKYYKNFKTKRMTVDAMVSCYERCKVECNCNSSACNSGIANAAAIAATPRYNGIINDTIAAYAAAG